MTDILVSEPGRTGSDLDDEALPRCCQREMICYPGVAYECAVAYFDLLDDGVLDSVSCSPPHVDDEVATDEHRRKLAHLRRTRIPLTR